MRFSQGLSGRQASACHLSGQHGKVKNVSHWSKSPALYTFGLEGGKKERQLVPAPRFVINLNGEGGKTDTGVMMKSAERL